MRLLLVCCFVLAIANSLFSNSDVNEACVEESPQVFAPGDVVVSCCYWFSLGSLDDPNDATFGRFVYGQSKIQKLKTIDKVCPAWCEYDRHTGYDPDSEVGIKACGYSNRYYSPAREGKTQALVWGTDGYVTNWTSAVTIQVNDRRKCGTGLITRRFIIEDRGIQYYADQNIWIVDCNPFYVSDECTDPDDDIEWPLGCAQPDILDGCGADLSPDNPLLGRPRVVNGADNQCNLIAIDFVDDTLTVEEDACLKVLRTWSVVDWCKYHPLSNPNTGRWRFLQIIKVRDKVDPNIACTIGDCNPAEKNVDGLCLGYIELTASGFDSCTVTDRLRFEYKIDLNDDGKGALGDYDLRVGPLSMSNENPSIQENEYAEIPDDVLNASGTYPIGVHRLKWFVEDGCGNVNLCDTTFEIKDCKAPTPYCKPGLITVVMPSTQSIEVNASDLDDGSFDNCSEVLRFSFSSDLNDTTRIYDCDSLGERIVQVWVTDEEGNQDYCESKYIIQDGAGNCTGTISAVRFSVLPIGLSSERHSLDEVELDVWVNGQWSSTMKVDFNSWTLDMSAFDASDRVEVELRDVAMSTNFVSMKDVAALTGHLLGSNPYPSFESYWASDLDQNGEISSRDISYLRKIILLPSSQWPRNLVNNYVFAPINAPGFDRIGYGHTSNRHVIDLSNIQSDYQFVPIKMGDIQD